jgi:hypothetical protein
MLMALGQCSGLFSEGVTSWDETGQCCHWRIIPSESQLGFGTPKISQYHAADWWWWQIVLPGIRCLSFQMRQRLVCFGDVKKYGKIPLIHVLIPHWGNSYCCLKRRAKVSWKGFKPKILRSGMCLFAKKCVNISVVFLSSAYYKSPPPRK